MYPKEKVAEAFLKVLENIKGHLSSIKEQDTERILNEIDKTKIDDEMKREDFLAKNVRVKPIQARLEKTTFRKS